MNYYNIITKLNLRKYKKSYLSLFIVIVLACTFTLAITIFNDSLLKTEEQQRKDLYGSWHISVYNTKDTLFNDLKNHGTINSIGKMTGYGNVLGKDNNATGVIGSVDDNTVLMGLSLMDGKFPEKDNEMAVEMSYLSMLGISYDIGQSISLRIQVYDDQSKKFTEIEKTFILSGVIKNYSSIWKTDGNQLISFFVTDTSLKTSPIFQNVFGTIKKDYVKNADELSVLTINKGIFVKNDYTYSEYASKNQIWYESFLSGSVLVLIVTLTSVFFILNVFNASLKEHNKSFIVMRSLGASKYEIAVLYSKELLVVLVLSFIIGIIVGSMISFFSYILIRHFVVSGFLFHFNIIKIMSLLFVIIVFVFWFAVFTVFRIGKMPLTGSIKLQSDNKRYLTRTRKFKPLTVRRMAKIFNTAHRREATMYFLLTTGTFLILAGSTFRSYQKYQDYSLIENTYTEDYIYGLMHTYMEPQNHMNEDEVECIRKIYGIDYVRAYRCSNYLQIYWKGIEKSKYAEYLSNNFFPKYAGGVGAYASVFGLSDNVKDYQLYIDEIDKGNVSIEEFLKGTEVIIYLPAFYNSQEFHMVNFWYRKYNPNEPQAGIMTENNINIGDEIIIKGGKGNITVKVAGIINDFEVNKSQSFLFKPYSVICNNVLYDKLLSPDDRKTYEYLQIYTSKNANYERTDVEISNFNNETNIINRRIQKETAKNNALVSIVVSLLLNFIIIFINALIQYNNQAAKMESDYRRNHILGLLGMDKSKIQLIYLYNILKTSILAILIGSLAIYFYQVVIYLNSIGGILKNKEMFDIAKYVYDTYFKVLPNLQICFIIIGYIIMNVVIAYFPLSKYRKINYYF